MVLQSPGLFSLWKLHHPWNVCIVVKGTRAGEGRLSATPITSTWRASALRTGYPRAGRGWWHDKIGWQFYPYSSVSSHNNIPHVDDSWYSRRPAASLWESPLKPQAAPRLADCRFGLFLLFHLFLDVRRSRGRSTTTWRNKVDSGQYDSHSSSSPRMDGNDTICRPGMWD